MQVGCWDQTRHTKICKAETGLLLLLLRSYSFLPLNFLCSHIRGENGVLTTVDDFFDVGGSEEEQVDLIQLVEKYIPIINWNGHLLIYIWILSQFSCTNSDVLTTELQVGCRYQYCLLFWDCYDNIFFNSQHSLWDWGEISQLARAQCEKQCYQNCETFLRVSARIFWLMLFWFFSSRLSMTMFGEYEKWSLKFFFWILVWHFILNLRMT